MEKVIYLTNGSAALSESYQQVESLKGTGKSKNLRAHHTAMQPIRSKEDFDKFCTYFLSNHNYRDYALFIVGIELGTLRSCDDYSGVLWATCPDFESRHSGEWEPCIPVIQSHFMDSIT